jgi:hypothetical protein
MGTPSQVFDMKAHEERLDALIRQTYSSSFMSNAKWRRLFQVLADEDLGVDQLIWKFVGRETEVRGAVPDGEGLGDKYVSGSSFSPFPYKEIEWIEVPAKSVPRYWEQVPQMHRPQPVDRVIEALTAVGQFEIEHRTGGTRIYGWR